MQFNGNNANNYEKCIHKVVSCYDFLQIPRISMDFCILHGNFFQNWFPGFAHILHVEFLTVCMHHNYLPAAEPPVRTEAALSSSKQQ